VGRLRQAGPDGQRHLPRFWLLENLKEGRFLPKGAGDPITGTIEYAVNTTVKAMSELETLDVNRVDVFDRYEFAWKFVGGDIVMSEFEKGVTSWRRASSTSTPARWTT
jgi:hypothetical protein